MLWHRGLDVSKIGVLAFLVAVLAAPTALALEPVRLEAPKVSAHVEGARVDLPTIDALPVSVIGTVEVRDVDVSVTGARCEIATAVHVKRPAYDGPECTPGEISTDSPQGLIDYEVALVLPESAPQDPADPAPLGTSAAIIDALPADPTVVLAAAAAAGVSMLGLYAAWRLLKWTGLAAFLPLYSHISDNEILDDPNRASIYRLIQTEPGISTKDIADRLDLAWGTVTHHLGKLEKRRFVVSKKYGKYRRYFANGAGGTDQKDAVAVLRLDRTGDVAQLIRQQPGVTQKAVSQALGVSSSTILWHVKRLEEVHLVRKVREGKLVRYYPGDGMSGVTLIPAATPMTAA